MGPNHNIYMNIVAELFNERFLKLVTIQNQGLLAELEGKERYPDLTVLRGQPKSYFLGDPESYEGRAPNPEDVILIVEVSDTSTGSDRGKKLDLYARSKITEYWQVDINDQTISVYRRKEGAELKKRSLHTPAA